MEQEKIGIFLSKINNWLTMAVIFLAPVFFGWFAYNQNVYTLEKIIIIKFFVLLILLLSLLKIIVNKKITIVKEKYFYIFAGLFFLLLISNLFFSANIIRSFWGSYFRQEGIYTFLYYFCFLFLLLPALNYSVIKKIIWTIVFAVVIPLVYGFVQFLGLDPLKWNGHDIRIFSTLGQPNFFAHYLVIIFPLLLFTFFFLAKKKITKVLVALVTILTFVDLILTYSRGGWIAFSVSMGVFLIFYLFKKKKQKIAYGLIILTIVFLSFVFSQAKIAHNLEQSQYFGLQRIGTLLNFRNTPTVRIRFLYWGAVLDDFQKSSLLRKLFGYGKENQEILFARKYDVDWGLYEYPNVYPDRAHNVIFDTWIEFGLVGLLVFALFFGFFIWKAIRYLLQKKEFAEQDWLVALLLISILAYFINNLFSFSMPPHYLYLYLYLAILGSIVFKQKEKKINFGFLSFKSRVIILLSLSIFLGLVFYSFDVRAFIADHYYRENKKTGDCGTKLFNLQKMIDEYHFNSYLRTQYLTVSNNCLASTQTKEQKSKVSNDILMQIASLPEKNFDEIQEIAHAYGLLGYYVDDRYFVLAEQKYEKVLEMNPHISSTYELYSQMKLWQGKPKQALQIAQQGLAEVASWKKAKKVHGKVRENIYLTTKFKRLIGDIYFTQKEYALAIKSYQEVLKLNPSFLLSYKDIAGVYYSWGKIDEAIKYTLEAYDIDPQKEMWPEDLTLLYNEKGDRKKAIEYALKTLEINPNNTKVKDILKK